MSRKIYVYDKALGKMVQLKRAPIRRAASTWPRVSDSMATNPESVSAERAELSRHGVDTEYDIVRNEDGEMVAARPIFRDQAHKKAHHRALGFYDADAGYGDAEPLHFTSDIKRLDVTNPATRRQLEAEHHRTIERILAGG